jgi:hypothetical protein
MVTHESSECEGSHTCHMCGLVVNKEEIKSNTHNCFNTLSLYLSKMMGDKDIVISLLKDEISRKNMIIRQLIDKQVSLEKKLNKIESVLYFEDENPKFILMNGLNSKGKDKLDLIDDEDEKVQS